MFRNINSLIFPRAQGLISGAGSSDHESWQICPFISLIKSVPQGATWPHFGQFWPQFALGNNAAEHFRSSILLGRHPPDNIAVNPAMNGYWQNKGYWGRTCDAAGISEGGRGAWTLKLLSSYEVEFCTMPRLITGCRILNLTFTYSTINIIMHWSGICPENTIMNYLNTVCSPNQTTLPVSCKYCVIWPIRCFIPNLLVTSSMYLSHFSIGTLKEVRQFYIRADKIFHCFKSTKQLCISPF